jgi:hypothetical protein
MSAGPEPARYRTRVERICKIMLNGEAAHFSVPIQGVMGWWQWYGANEGLGELDTRHKYS